MIHFDEPRTLNRDAKTRDELIFGEFNPEAYCGNIRHFESLTVDTLKRLLEKNFIDPDEHQNNAPTTAQILNFMERYPAYTAHGYAVSINRKDYRMTLEGVSKGRRADSALELADFTELFKLADSFNPSIMECWFD